MKKLCFTFIVILSPVFVVGQEKEPEFRYGINFGMTRYSVLSLEESKLVDKGRAHMEVNEPITYETIDENDDVWEIKYFFSRYNRLNKIVERTNNPSLYLIFLLDMENEFGEPEKEWTSHNRDEKVAHFFAVFKDTERGVMINLQLSVYPNDSSFYMHFSPLQKD